MKFTSIYLLFIGLIVQTMALAQSAGENYIRTFDVKYPNIASTSLNINTHDTIANQTIQYFDGLGRPKQTVQVGAAPDGSDMIKPVKYNDVGLDEWNFLPYPSGNNRGSFREQYEQDQAYYYNTTFGSATGLSPIDYEKSPLNRVLKQGSPGPESQLNPPGHFISYYYLSNTNNDSKLTAKLWKVTGTTCESTGNYENNQLYVNKIVGENEAETYEFKDKQEQVVLKRSILGTDILVDTYYVYDDFGLLRFVISPEGSAQITGSFTATSTLAKQYVYCYTYDARKRLIEKQIPGKDPEYYVYNNNDQVILYQDGNMRKLNGSTPAYEWQFTKYDALGRVIMTGITRQYTNQTRTAMQDIANANTYSWEIMDGEGVYYEYSNRCIPQFDLASCTLLTLAYYDTYHVYKSKGESVTKMPLCPDPLLDCNIPVADYRYYSPDFVHVTGMPTVSATNVAITSTSAVLNYSCQYYDNRGRVIQSNAQNHRAGYDYITNLYRNLTPNVWYSKHAHSTRFVPSINTLVTEETSITYDHAGRVLNNKLKFQGTADKQAVTSVYNRLGQLVSKGIYEGSTLMQQVDYAYNIKGWLTAINNPATMAQDGDLFAMNLLYETQNTALGNTPAYNGNISAIVWSTAQPTGITTPVTTGIKAYKYSYDALNRLLEGTYSEQTTPTTWNHSNRYGEKIFNAFNNKTYDLNGNIQGIHRVGLMPPNGTQSVVDMLRYFYQGNQLVGVDDAVNSNMGGFYDNYSKYATSGVAEYSYDANGNLTRDDNKKIVSITYNHLNLPQSINKAGGSRVEYEYDANGTKLKQLYYENGTLVKTTDFIANFVYENGIPLHMGSSEGRIVYKSNGNTWFTETQVKDHLGSVRAVCSRNSTNGSRITRQVDSYYPFGMNIKELSQTSDVYLANEYMYNGKMYQDEMGLALLDYGFRFYDPALARWNVVDPLAETYSSWSPYHYAMNNPIRYTDVFGMGAGNFYDENGNYLGTDGIGDNIVYIVTDKQEKKEIKATNKEGGTTKSSDVSSEVETTKTELGESLDVLNRTVLNGGNQEECSVVTESGVVIKGQTGSADSKTLSDGTVVKTTTLPSNKGNNNTSIHSHQTAAIVTTDGLINSSSATEPGPADPGIFKGYNRNIIVGNLGYSSGEKETDGSVTVRTPSKGAVIYDRNSKPLVQLKQKAIERMIK